VIGSVYVSSLAVVLTIFFLTGLPGGSLVCKSFEKCENLHSSEILATVLSPY
jgi:hypothetical protein